MGHEGDQLKSSSAFIPFSFLSLSVSHLLSDCFQLSPHSTRTSHYYRQRESKDGRKVPGLFFHGFALLSRRELARQEIPHVFIPGSQNREGGGGGPEWDSLGVII